MSMKQNGDLGARVARHPFLAGMSTQHIELLGRCASLKQFEEGEVIFRAGEPANGFYLIESGTVTLEGSVFEHGAISTDILSAGDPLGWSWLFEPYRWHYDARAIRTTTAFFFDKTIFEKCFSEDLSLAHELFKRMSEVMVRRLQSSRAQLIEARKKPQKKK